MNDFPEVVFKTLGCQWPIQRWTNLPMPVWVGERREPVDYYETSGFGLAIR